jgi:hypothetical protein
MSFRVCGDCRCVRDYIWRVYSNSSSNGARCMHSSSYMASLLNPEGPGHALPMCNYQTDSLDLFSIFMEDGIQPQMRWRNTRSLPSISAVLGSTLWDSTASSDPLASLLLSSSTEICPCSKTTRRLPQTLVQLHTSDGSIR